MAHLSRKEFVRFLLVGASAAALGHFGCSDDESTSSTVGGDGGTDGGGDDSGNNNDAGGDAGGDGGGNACTTDLVLDNNNGGITSGHAHAFTIPAADLNSTTDKMYTMSGDHVHNVTVTAADFTMLRAGQTVMKVSSETGHTHNVTIKC